MDHDRWARVQALFEAALARPAAERAALLADACAGDEALRREVESLLAADTSGHSLFDGLALDALGGAPGDVFDDALGAPFGDLLDEPPLEGRRVGPYRLTAELGRGGMGVVYLGERDDGAFRQRVAVKLVKRGMDSDEILRRFRAEREILARLQHPGIARLLDGGRTDDGRPYFAVEYVDGEPIDAYCDRRRLPVDARLQLFEGVCEAVGYAHRNLVVHRDLKPSNILVTEEDGRPQVKLLDFGIAKLLAGDDGASVFASTRTGLRAMTPAYAAPEQVRGEPPSTATDVYALGVLLYELLTGRRPYRVATRVAREIERAILTEEPERPSTALAAPGAAERSRDRGTDAGRLRRRLAGDLDMICLVALRKEPERRYDSAALLLDDVRRHRRGLPVAARPDAPGYRLRKFVRRHRRGVAATAAAVVVVAGLVAFYTVQLRAERDRARAEAAKAAEVAAFLRGIFAAVDPAVAQGEDVTARALLDAGAARADADLAGQPEVHATMLRELGVAYTALGRAGEARPLLERAVAGHRATLGPEHVETAASEAALAIALQDLGDVGAAEPLFRRALATRRALLAPGDPAVSASLSDLAYLHEAQGDFAAAEPLFREALALEDRRHGPDHPGPAMMRTRLARHLRGLDRHDEAEALLRDALATLRRHHAGPHPDVASTLRNLAAVLRDTDRYDEAEALYREAVAMRRALHGAVHPEVVHTLNSYTLLLSAMGAHDRALDTMRTVVALQERLHDAPHPTLAAVHHNLGTMLHDAGDLAGAAEAFRRAMEVQDAVLAPDHPNRAFTLTTLAAVLRDDGRPAEAEPLLRRALVLREDAYPADHRYVGDTRSELGACLVDLGRYAEAEPLLTAAHAAFTAALGPDDGRTRRAAARLERLHAAREATPDQ